MLMLVEWGELRGLVGFATLRQQAITSLLHAQSKQLVEREAAETDSSWTH